MKHYDLHLIIEELIQKGFKRQELEAKFNLDCTFDNWKEKAEKYRADLQNAEGDIIEGQWQTAEYHSLEREKYYDLADSPLEILAFCIASDFQTYPPPEILQVIAHQFNRYMVAGGELTLEEAFFGSQKRRGSYANRKKKENLLYSQFHLIANIAEYKNMSQHEILEDVLENPDSKNDFISRKAFIEEYKASDPDYDTFLKGYRRWKKARTDT